MLIRFILRKNSTERVIHVFPDCVPNASYRLSCDLIYLGRIEKSILS